MKKFFTILLTVSIPALLFMVIWQSSRYTFAEKVLYDYDAEQKRIVQENKRKISGISVLLKKERIETIALETLGMQKAPTAEIIRIKIDAGAQDE